MKVLRAIIVILCVAALFHFAWESLHVSLYTGYESLPFASHITLYATAGDVLYTLIALLCLSLFKTNIRWIYFPRKNDYISLCLIGFIIALFVEYKALALHLWSYLPSMPVLPFFHVGTSPIIQMTLLLPLSVFVGHYIHKKITS